MSVSDVFFALLVIGLVMIVAKLVRRRIGLFRRLFLPASVVGGALALLVGPQVLGRLAGLLDAPEVLHDGLLPPAVVDVWSQLPVLLISVVFAALFLGKPIPPLKQIWEMAGPQVAFGQSIAWGQYVVGISLTMLILTPVFGMDPVAGALLEIGFEGGHGTAAGLATTFEAFGFPEGTDLALGLATIGLVGGVLVGTFIVNWGVRTGRVTLVEGGDATVTMRDGTDDDRCGSERQVDTRTAPSDPLSPVRIGITSPEVRTVRRPRRDL
jgi:ESS family glutamate:Na+ symporter